MKPLGITRFTVKVAPVSTQKRVATIVNDLEQVFKNNKLLSSPAILELYDDTADPWGMSAEELKSMGKNPQEFRLMTEQEAGDFCAVKGGMAPIRRIEKGKVYTGVECFYTAGRTNAALQYKLYKNSPYMDIQLTVEFMDKNKLLRLKVPIPKSFQGGKVVGDGPYVWEEKGDCEITFQKWLGTQKRNGEIFAVANDGTYAGKAENGYLHFTLLRGSGYCFHPIRTRKLYPEDRYLPRIDCGRYVYNFRVFKGNIYNVTLMSEMFNLPPYAVNVFPTGKINNDKVILSNNIKIEGNVLISAIIPHEDDRFVIRIYNPSSEKEEFTLHVGEKFIQSEAMPYAVVSYIYHQGIFKEFKDTMPT